MIKRDIGSVLLMNVTYVISDALFMLVTVNMISDLPINFIYLSTAFYVSRSIICTLICACIICVSGKSPITNPDSLNNLHLP